MTLLPDLIKCSENKFLLKKVYLDDVLYIWETSPLEQLFLVLGNEVYDLNELLEIMQLDWTTWYLMLGEEGHSYGLIRVIPELDNNLSLHGIGWTQDKMSPRIFVLSWFAFHYYLFGLGIKKITTYCDSLNSNAIRFDLKTGYVYDYFMPSGDKTSKVLHLKINNKKFNESLKKLSLIFDLSTSQFGEWIIPKYFKGRAYTKRFKNIIFFTNQLIEENEIKMFINKYMNSKYFYFYYLIPKPYLFKITIKSKKFLYLFIAETNQTKNLVLFISDQFELYIYLDLIAYIKNLISLNKDDVFFLNDQTKSFTFKDAMSIHFKYAGNHSNCKTDIWIV